MEALYKKYSAQQFITVVLLDSGTPQAWSSKHSLTHPVLQVDSNTAWRYWQGTNGQQGYPSAKTIKTNMVVNEEHFNFVEESQIPPILP